MHPRIRHVLLPTRRHNQVRSYHYAAYIASAATLAARGRPDYIYASDVLSALPALVSAKVSGAAIIYHEHDSPDPGALRASLTRWRAQVATAAQEVIFPNEDRARLVPIELGIKPKFIRVIWNTPRKSELPTLKESCRPRNGALTLYYHGSITRERLPEAVVEAVRRMNGKARLRIVGYEAPSEAGYLSRLLVGSMGEDGVPLVEYAGPVDRESLLAVAAEADIGLALMPMKSDDINMRHMAGASNKAFDYMAAGLALLVSDLPDREGMFVAPGYARACRPEDVGSIVAALSFFAEKPEDLRRMRLRNREKIAKEWNYDCQFGSLLQALAHTRKAA